MARTTGKLSARTIAGNLPSGRYSDGGNLYLVVEKSGAKRWVFIYRRARDGRQSEMGLGGISSVSLAKAREKAAGARAALADGTDPIGEAKSKKADMPTFGVLADEVIASLESGWRNPKHRAQWHMTMEVYCAPLRMLPVDHITTEDVLAVLKPIWHAKAETASRVRGRIEKILDAAKARNFRQGENPARWRGHLDHLLPVRQRLQRGHHPAMPFDDVPVFMTRLRAMDGLSVRALEFLILSGARTTEARSARWEEFDFSANIWSVPPERMKTGRLHRVPLTDRMSAILSEVEPLKRADGFVFPSTKIGKPLSEMAMEQVMRRLKVKPWTVHGFRSSFKDWATETTQFANELSEAALSHNVGDKVERAYRRGDALARRRELMEVWERFCDPERVSNVIPINAANQL